MKRMALVAVAAGLLAWAATPAHADTQPTARDVQAAVDTYLASAEHDATLVGGIGNAGYDQGFWIRGGDFALRINLTLQARFEWFNFDDDEEPFPGGDLSGFSLPRAIVKFSGEAPCNIRYYIALDFGHFGREAIDEPNNSTFQQNLGVFGDQSWNFDNTREAWIEWGCSPALNFRMGQIQLATTRQLMVPPELQQFIDISMASAVTGLLMPGYTDRNRDHGIMVHGAFGCDGEFSYMVTASNGDGGDSIRNVLDVRTSDNLAYGARLNWAFLAPIHYEEGALRQSSCVWYGEVGAWAFYYADRQDKPHFSVYDALYIGGDVALGYGGFSFTGAFTYVDFSDSDIGLADETWLIWLVQLGYHIPDTSWEIAARWSVYDRDIDGGANPTTTEFAGVINYYLNGHGNKLSVDFTFISPDDSDGGGYFDVYSGVPLGFDSFEDSWLLRFQWQLAL